MQRLMANIIYEDFDALIERYGEGYRLHVIASPAGEARVDFLLPFTREELAALPWVSGYGLRNFQLANLGEKSFGAADPLTPQAFGVRLFKAAMAGNVNLNLRESLAQVAHRNSALRIRLRFDENAADLACLPWEFLYDPALNRFILLSQETTVARYLQIEKQQTKTPLDLPMRILVVAAAPVDIAPLEVEKEWRNLETALAPLCAAGLIEVETLKPASVATLARRVLRDDVHVLHFIGHGYYDSKADEGGLVFEDDARQAHCVSATALSVLLHDRKALQLVFLNSCEGARGSQGNLFAGTAQQLTQQGVPMVVAMQSPIKDKAAIVLSQRFYESIAEGYPVDAGVTQARKALFLHDPQQVWGTPVLFSRLTDNRLLDLPLPQRSLAFERLSFEPQTVLVPGGSFLMGNQQEKDVPPEESPQHSVFLTSFWIGVYPITNAEYAKFIASSLDQSVPSRAWLQRRPPPGREDFPVVGVSWHDATEYCAWLSQQTGHLYRLPTEAEWEKAARGVNGRRYPWGDEWEVGYDPSKSSRVTPVMIKTCEQATPYHPDASSPYGCYDMLGNVQEWTSTIWGYTTLQNEYPYPYVSRDGREEEHCSRSVVYRVSRGGLLNNTNNMPHCATRQRAITTSRTIERGFRVVLADW